MNVRGLASDWLEGVVVRRCVWSPNLGATGPRAEQRDLRRKGGAGIESRGHMRWETRARRDLRGPGEQKEQALGGEDERAVGQAGRPQRELIG